MSNRTARISKRSVDALQIPEVGEVRLWDTEVRGFFVRAYVSGRKTYALKYRFGRTQRIFTLGAHGDLTPDTARAAAKAALQKARDGLDPAVAKAELRDALTVGALIDAYLSKAPIEVKLNGKPKRASSWANDASNLNSHIRPLLGRVVASAVTTDQAEAALAAIRAGKTARTADGIRKRGRVRITGGNGAARRVRGAASAMFAWAHKNGYASGNPFVGIAMGDAPIRERFLTRAEVGRLLDAMGEMEASGVLHPAFGDAIRLLLLTGARRTEVLGLRWAEVDFSGALLVLPPARTKAGGMNGVRRIDLSAPALEILSRRHAADANGDGFVFPALRGGQGHLIGLRPAFLRACAHAGLADLRVHDMRHSYASFAIADGASLHLVGKLLGHANTRSTERYSHIDRDMLKDAAASIAAKIMPGDPAHSAEVIRLGVGGR
jgi:integrase